MGTASGAAGADGTADCRAAGTAGTGDPDPGGTGAGDPSSGDADAGGAGERAPLSGLSGGGFRRSQILRGMWGFSAGENKSVRVLRGADESGRAFLRELRDGSAGVKRNEFSGQCIGSEL